MIVFTQGNLLDADAEASLLEIQKLAYFLERAVKSSQLDNPLKLKFEANKFGPYAPRLTYLLNALTEAISIATRDSLTPDLSMSSGSRTP